MAITAVEAADCASALLRKEKIERGLGIALLVGVAVWLIWNFLAGPVQFVNVALAGLRLGALYALIALGYTLVYGIIELINFAHGDLFMLGVGVLRRHDGHTGSVPSSPARSGWALMLADPARRRWRSVRRSNVVIERVAYRRLRRAPKLAPLITAVGMSFILQWVGLFAGTARRRSSGRRSSPTAASRSAASPSQYVDDRGRRRSPSRVLLLLTYIVQRTKQGKAMRATAQDQDAARLMGINVDRTIAFTFALGGAMAGAAGLLFLESVGTTRYDAGFQLGLIAFTAAVLGGIGNLQGAVLGGVAHRRHPGPQRRCCPTASARSGRRPSCSRSSSWSWCSSPTGILGQPTSGEGVTPWRHHTPEVAAPTERKSAPGGPHNRRWAHRLDHRGRQPVWVFYKFALTAYSATPGPGPRPAVAAADGRSTRRSSGSSARSASTSSSATRVCSTSASSPSGPSAATAPAGSCAASSTRSNIHFLSAAPPEARRASTSTGGWCWSWPGSICAFFGILIGAPTLRLKSDYLAHRHPRASARSSRRSSSTARTSTGSTSPTATKGIAPLDPIAVLPSARGRVPAARARSTSHEVPAVRRSSPRSASSSRCASARVGSAAPGWPSARTSSPRR